MNNLQLSTPIPSANGSYVFHRCDDQFGSAVTYSWYPSRKSAVAHRITESFHELAYRFLRKPAVTSKDDGPRFSPFTYPLLPQRGDSVGECNFLTLTIEKVSAFRTGPKDILKCVEGLASFVYTTRTHSYRVHRGGSYQLVVALRTPIPVEHYKQVATSFAQRFWPLDGGINSSYMLSDQRIAIPSCSSIRRQDQFELVPQKGRAYDWLPDFLEHRVMRSSAKWSAQ